MATLSTSAWVLHDLGNAACFGGSLFGKLALHPAAGAASSREERGRIVNAAWKYYAPINLLGQAASALTWAVGRSMLSGRSLGRGTRNLVLLKDGLVITSFATGMTTQLLGRSIEMDAPFGLPLDTSGNASAYAPERAKVKEQVVASLGTVNLIANAALIAVTAILAMKSSKSNVFAAIGQFLP